MQILGFLYLYKNPKRTLKIADDIYKIDSLNCYSYVLKAIVANSCKDYDRALVLSQKAYLCDSTSISSLALIINLNIRLKNFPDAIKYINKISYDDPVLNVYHISGAICHIKIGLLATAKYILSRIKIHSFPMDVYEQIDSLSGYIDRLSNNTLNARDSFYVITPGFWTVLTPTEQNFIAFRDCYPKHFTYPKLEKHGFVYQEDIRKLLGAQGIKKEPVFGVVIDRKGNIEDVVTLIPSGNQPLDDYYTKWFYTTKFKPATMFGQPQYYRFYKPIKDILKGLFN